MSTTYKVKQGDCMSSIGMQFGFYWETLWNSSDNADLKELRKNPNVLLPGDVVVIPNITVKDESRADGARYKFMRKGVPEKLRLKLLDSDKKPRTHLAYTLFIDGDSRTGETDGAGEIIQPIPPDAQEGKLILKGDEANPIMLDFGHLNPITTVSGQKSRLMNLGYYFGPVDENFDAAAKKGMNDFQKAQGLPITEEMDDATQSKLLQVHGH